MIIRDVQPSDRQAISRLLAKIGNFTQEEKSCAEELLAVYLDQPHQKDYFFFCCVDVQENVLGFVCFGHVPLTDAVYDLYWIAVDSSRQNQGIGGLLMDHLDESLLARAARMLLAETSSKISYGKTRAFYERCGFEQISRIPDFYAENDDKIVFAKFYRLYERRRRQQWTTLIEGRMPYGPKYPTSSGTTGIGRLETASEV